MKQIPAVLLASYARPTKSTTFLVKIVAKDGTVMGFTTLDDRYLYDGLWYEPDQALVPQNIQNTVEIDEADNTELHGWFDAAVQALMLAGKFSGGEITIYRVSYLIPDAGAEMVAFGTVGRVQYAADGSMKRKVEWKGLDEPLITKRNPLLSLTCRNDFGDAICKMPLEWENAVVAEVSDPRLRFRVTGITRPDDYFVLGLVLFTSGENTDNDVEIESWTADGWIKLSYPTSYNVTMSTTVKVRRDCDKTFATCLAYANVINMNAEHLTPVQDQSLMIPGAYIKSSQST